MNESKAMSCKILTDWFGRTDAGRYTAQREQQFYARALAGLHAFAPHAHHLLELSVLVAANLVATAVRFVLLRGWVFHPRRAN